MKFEYDGDVQAPKEPVAVIDEGGDIWFVCNEGWSCISDGHIVIINTNPTEEYGAVKVFYPGDKLTITF